MRLLILTLFLPVIIQAQSASEVLEKAVKYHDPNGEWKTLKATFNYRETRPDGDDRVTVLQLNNAANWHKLNRNNEEEYVVKGNGEVEVTLGDKEGARGKMLRNYYVYLWGLPMKLLDKDTRLQPNAGREKIKGKEYVTVAVKYDKEDYTFFFDPKTYRMMAYRFYKNDNSGKGEIIHLKDEIKVGTMRISKERSWYELPGEKFLGTDILESVE